MRTTVPNQALVSLDLFLDHSAINESNRTRASVNAQGKHSPVEEIILFSGHLFVDQVLNRDLHQYTIGPMLLFKRPTSLSSLNEQKIEIANSSVRSFDPHVTGHRVVVHCFDYNFDSSLWRSRFQILKMLAGN